MKDFKDFYKCSRRDGLENTLRLFYGSYYGIVVDNQDPKQVGRVKVKVPQITDDQVIDVWARPKSIAGTDSGFFAVPEVGGGVWVEFEFGNPRYPVYNGGWWAAPQSGDPESPQEAQGDDYPNVSIWKSTGGNYLLFNDVRNIVRLQSSQDPFIELSNNLVKLYGESEPAVLGDKNGDLHDGHISQLQDVVAQLQSLINAQTVLFTALATALPPMQAPIQTYNAAAAIINSQLTAINGQLIVLKTDIAGTKSAKVKLD